MGTLEQEKIISWKGHDPVLPGTEGMQHERVLNQDTRYTRALYLLVLSPLHLRGLFILSCPDRMHEHSELSSVLEQEASCAVTTS